MTSHPRSRRVSLRLEVTPDSLEAQLLTYLKGDAIASSREMMLRALKAFYLPWAMEGELSTAELKGLAQSAIEELQFRIFQINQRYLTEETPGYSPGPVLTKAAARTAPSSSPPSSVTLPPQSVETTVEQMRQSINLAQLDDF